MRSFLLQTAWPMTPPAPYSLFHLVLCAAGIFLAVRLAVLAARSERVSPAGVLGSCGLILAVMEIYKQGFLYFVENGGRYDWWYFPFQLCSVPMYLCLFYPAVGRRERSRAGSGGRPADGKARVLSISATFIQDFGLLGGAMALAVPDGLMHPYWTMTLHGFLWHFLLIFSGVYCAGKELSDQSGRGYLRVLPLFFVCCLTAIAINTAAGPSRDADMFYISPYHPSSQPVFRQISMAVGIFPGILIYLAAVIAGGWIVHAAVGCMSRRRLEGGRTKTKHAGGRQKRGGNETNER